jgi:hypothetical protein
MTKDETHRSRWPHAMIAANLAVCIVLAAHTAAAQDPPPPMLPSDTPEPVKPDAPPPAPPPEAPPSALPPPAPSPQAWSTPTPLPEAAPPAEAPTARRGTAARTLKGHTFPTPFLLDTAFITTHVGLGVELGHQWNYGAFTGAQSAMGSETTYQYDQSISVTTEYLSAGLALNEKTEIGVDASYSSVMGSDVNTAILYGGQTSWNLRPGARFRLLHSASTGSQLSLHLYGNFGSGAQQNPLGVIGEIAAEINTVAQTGNTTCLAAGELACALTGKGYNAQTSVSTTRTAVVGGATFSLAQAVSSLFGLQFSLGAEAGHAWLTVPGNGGMQNISVGSTEIGSTPFAFHVGMAGSLDFGPTVPLALMGEYLFTVNYEPTEGTASDSGAITTLQSGLVAGAFYTGRSDFVLGALFTATFSQGAVGFDDGSSDSLAPTTIVTGQVTARYFF